MKQLKRKVIDDFYTYEYKGKLKKTKSYRVIFQYLLQNGEVKTLKPRFKKKSDAYQELERLIKKETEANGAYVAEKDHILVKDYAESYKREILKKLSPTSHANEISRIDEVIKVFGHRTIASITRRDIKNYREHLEKKVAKNAKKIDGVAPTLSSESVRKYLSKFRAMLNEARRDYRGLPVFDFTGDIMPKKKKPRNLIIDFFEFDRLLAACTGKQEKMRLFIISLWETGARVSEIIGNTKRLDYLPGIKRKDIDLGNQRIKLWNSKLAPGKEPEQRVCYLSLFFRDSLVEAGVEKLEPEESIFKRGDFRKSWKKILEVAEVNPDFWERDLRHCFASNADRAGVPRAAIKHQVNHAGDDLLEMTYINIREEDLSDLFNRYETYCRERRDEVERQKQKAQASAFQ